MSVTRLTPQQFEASRNEPNTVVIDVRTPNETNGGTLEGALTSDWLGGQFEAEFNSFDKAKTYFLYCRSGMRSGAACALMQQVGFTSVYNVGGYDELREAGIK